MNPVPLLTSLAIGFSNASYLYDYEAIVTIDGITPSTILDT